MKKKEKKKIEPERRFSFRLKGKALDIFLERIKEDEQRFGAENATLTFQRVLIEHDKVVKQR